MADPQPEPHAERHDAIHLPPPSIWPPVLALGIALLLTGLILNLAVTVAGAIVSLAAAGLWARAARREFRDLPE